MFKEFINNNNNNNINIILNFILLNFKIFIFHQISFV